MSQRPTMKTAAMVIDVFWPEFRVDGDLIFLASEQSESIEAPVDRTACEASVNHVPVLDRFAHGASLGKEPFWDAGHPDFRAACDEHPWLSEEGLA